MQRRRLSREARYHQHRVSAEQLAYCGPPAEINLFILCPSFLGMTQVWNSVQNFFAQKLD
jgi:hypothetical protein